ncbi:MAG TPA: DNA translocase FtsK 4TM domain-containing protein [bacterium]
MSVILNTVISVLLLLIACGVLIVIAQRLDESKQRRLLGIVMFLVAVLFLISQISFLIFPALPGNNFGGLLGYYTSYAVFFLIGLYFFCIPLILIYLSHIYVFRSEQQDGYHLLYAVPVGLIVDSLLALFVILAFNGMPVSGRLGVVVTEFLLQYFGRVGTFMIIGFGIIIMLFMMMKKIIIPQRLKEPVIKIMPPVEKLKKERAKVPKEEPPAEPGEKKGDANGDTPGKKKTLPRIDFKAEFLKILVETQAKRGVNEDTLKKEAEILTRRLEEFDVQGKVTGIESGPVISRFEFEPAPGIKVNRIANLDNDLALALKATRIRIVAPIPGKSAVGIEVPNRERSLVFMKGCIMDPDFENNPSPLAIALGEDITGKPVSDDISAMPHMLIAGTTGSGKSVCINAIIASLLYHASYKDLRFLMIDPKRLELPMYNAIPHLLRRAVIEPKDAVEELEQCVAIMESRYRDFARENVRDIDGYNEKMRKKDGRVKPYIVIIVDELADLMLTAPSEIEENITRLAQMSRAVGIHLVLATQRPSVDVITGLIKANFPCRIAFQVASKTDSRTILDMNGAESLLGRGDMLFLPPGKGTPIRLHGAYISTEEVCAISRLIAQQHLAELMKDVEADQEEIINAILDEELWTVFVDQDDPAFGEKRKALSNVIPNEKIDEIILTGYYPQLGEVVTEEESTTSVEEGEVDPMFKDAARLVFRHQIASVSLLQRRLNLGYARAGRIVDQLEAAGIVEPFQGSKSRKVLVERQEVLDDILNRYPD